MVKNSREEDRFHGEFYQYLRKKQHPCLSPTERAEATRGDTFPMPGPQGHSLRKAQTNTPQHSNVIELNL